MKKQKRVRMFVAACVVALSLGAMAGSAARAVIFAPVEDMEVWVPEGGEQYSAPAAMLPGRLIIPKLDVNAAVQRTGITARGTMAVPASYGEAGWYRYGPAPGQAGSAVMAGHLDNGAGFPAVFARLQELRAGDDIYVQTAGGERIRFKVVALREYSHDEVPTHEIFKESEFSHLNLITCAGEWLSREETYDKRLVVYATRVARS